MRVFSEIQRFNQWWIHLLSIGSVALPIYLFYQWYVEKQPTGNVSPNDLGIHALVLFSILPVLLLLYSIKLRTEINETGIQYQFFPFQLSQKSILWKEMEHCQVRTYNPIKEYGGWGYKGKFRGKGMALNIRGNQGIQIKTRSGKSLLIGTQQPEKAQEVIDRYYKNDHQET